MPAAPKPKARRTHARRSCNLCKVRKTRCELPDLDIPSSSDPLPEDKACHRCRVLSLPCVVDDTNMKSRKQQDANGAGSSKSQDDARTRASSTSTVDQSRTAKRQRVTSTDSNMRKDITPNSQAPAPPFNQDTFNSEAYRAMRLHSRPISLAAALLKFLDGQIPRKKLNLSTPPGQSVVDLVDEGMRSKLAPGFDQLRTLHPHLQRMDDLFSMSREREFDPALELLFATTLYLSTQYFCKDPEVLLLRDALAPHVLKLQHIVLAKQSPSFYAIQALEMLALHAPFSPSIPYVPADLTLLEPSRGLIGTAQNISASINFDSLINFSINHLERPDNPDFWLWLGLRATEAQSALEAEPPLKPPSLAEARASSEPLMQTENAHVWLSASRVDDHSELLGKLTVCDRLVRLDELHNTLSRFPQILEMATEIQNFPAAAAIDNELRNYQKLQAAIEERHNIVFNLICPTPTTLSSAWVTYRTLQTTSEQMTALKAGFQALIALHFLPGSVLALPTVSDMPTRKTMLHATTRATNPDDIMQAFAASPISDAIRKFANQRTALSERMFQTFTTNYTDNQLLPLHGVAALLLDAAKCRTLYQARRGTAPTEWLTNLQRCVDILDQNGDDITHACSDYMRAMISVVGTMTPIHSTPLWADIGPPEKFRQLRQPLDEWIGSSRIPGVGLFEYIIAQLCGYLPYPWT